MTVCEHTRGATRWANARARGRHWSWVPNRGCPFFVRRGERQAGGEQRRCYRTNRSATVDADAWRRARFAQRPPAPAARPSLRRLGLTFPRQSSDEDTMGEL